MGGQAAHCLDPSILPAFWPCHLPHPLRILLALFWACQAHARLRAFAHGLVSAWVALSPLPLVNTYFFRFTGPPLSKALGHSQAE